MPDSNANQRQSQRLNNQKKVEFFVDADIINSESVDISEHGIRLVSSKPIQLSMRIYENETTWTDYQGDLCWAGKDANGKMGYGLEFVESPDW